MENFKFCKYLYYLEGRRENMKIWQKMDALLLRTKCRFECFAKNERGDTNFISILVILAIVTALIAAFLVFKDQILGWVNNTMNKFWE